MNIKNELESTDYYQGPTAEDLVAIRTKSARLAKAHLVTGDLVLGEGPETYGETDFSTSDKGR